MQNLKVRSISSFKQTKLGEVKNIESSFLSLKDNLSDYEWWLSAGTAIGLYRNKDVIPNDTDIDIGIKSKLGQKHILLDKFKLVRKMDWENRPIQTAHIDPRNNCLIDIYYYYTDIKNGKLVTISEYGWIHYKTPYIIKNLYEIKNLHTKYGDLPFLHPIEEYLTERFGDWKTPSNKKGKYSATL